jgi:hypothetical protein
MCTTDRREVRWGVRTLLYLGLTLLAIGVSTVQGHYTLLTLTALCIGLLGALICSLRGIRAFTR